MSSVTEEIKNGIKVRAKNSIKFWPSGLVILLLAFAPASCSKGERSMWEALVALVDAKAKELSR